MIALKSCGQATVEYIFILAFAVMLGFQFTNRFTEFFRDSLGSVGHVLSTHLTTGMCKQDCWYEGYKNAFVGEGP